MVDVDVLGLSSYDLLLSGGDLTLVDLPLDSVGIVRLIEGIYGRIRYTRWNVLGSGL